MSSPTLSPGLTKGGVQQFSLKEMQTLMDGHFTHVMASLSADLKGLASSFEKDVYIAMRKRQSELIKRSWSTDVKRSGSAPAESFRNNGGFGPVVLSPEKPPSGIGEDSGPHDPNGGDGKLLPTARGDELVPALPTVLEHMVQHEVDPAARVVPASRQLSMKSSQSADMNISMLSSEVASPYVQSISPASSENEVHQPGNHAQNSTNLQKVLAAGRKSVSVKQQEMSNTHDNLQSAEMHDKIASVIGTMAEHSWLDCVMGFLVLLNALAMAVELECIGNQSGETINVHVTWHCADSAVFPVLEHVFTWIFFFFLALRARATRCRYFTKLVNIGDTFLVILPIVDLYILSPLAGMSANIDILRLLRLGKLARAVRLMRTLKLFRGLRLLVQACSSFLPSLAWSMALLGICMLMGSLVMSNLLQDFITDSEKPMEARLWVWMYYGTAYRAMYTMYEVTFAGNWPTRARPLLEDVDHRYAIFFIIYVTFIVFAVIRIITAVFLRETLEAANNDAELMVQERLLQNARYVKKLEGIFAAMDDSGDGVLTEDEMTQLLMDQRVQAYLQSLDLDVAEGQALFQLLQNGEGMVTYEDFIDGILRCKGPARAIDQICLQCEVKSVADSLRILTSALEETKLINNNSSNKRKTGKKKKIHKEDLLLLGVTNRSKPMSRQTSPQ